MENLYSKFIYHTCTLLSNAERVPPYPEFSKYSQGIHLYMKANVSLLSSRTAIELTPVNMHSIQSPQSVRTIYIHHMANGVSEQGGLIVNAGKNRKAGDARKSRNH